MEKAAFVKQYITKPRTVGAILPSSKHLAGKMVEDIDFNNAKYIIEYGPGTGVFTKKLIENRKDNTVILLFEYNTEFCNILREKFKDVPYLYIVNDSAEFIDKYLRQYNIPMVDYVVSGLPFASLPQNISSAILEKTQKFLREDGKFITFQYTLLKKNFIKQYFNVVNIKMEVRNMPPAYVFSCSH